MSSTPERMTGSSGSSELEQLAARLDELQRRSDGLTAALAQAKKTRLLVMGAFLVFVVIAGWSFYSLAMSVRNDAYTTALKEALQKAIEQRQDEFSLQARKLMNDVAPVVQTAFSEQTSKDMPIFMQIIDKEREGLMTRLPEQLANKVENHHHDLLRKHTKLIESEFPTVKDPKTRDQMMENACLALDRLIKKYYVDEFKKELQRMADAWDEFPRADIPTEDEPPLTTQLVGNLLEVMLAKASGAADGPTVQSPPPNQPEATNPPDADAKPESTKQPDATKPTEKENTN